jgi:glutamate-5-semialdehyde dehydrogenase
METLEQLIDTIGKAALAASRELSLLSPIQKNAVLERMAVNLINQTQAIIAANALDLEAGRAAGLTSALLDRLTLNPKRIEQMAKGVRELIALPDPVGEVIETTQRPNGLSIEKRRVPIGVVGIIYESRPNVTVDCASLCFKSGNASILRGGKEAIHSNTLLAEIIQSALVAEGLSPTCVQLIPTTDRQALTHLLKRDDLVHCIIPRGGESLIRFVAENARMPVIKHYNGICNLYIDAAADLKMAENIVINAKCQRPGVCNAAENLFVHTAIANEFLPRIATALQSQKVELRAGPLAEGLLKSKGFTVVPATEADFYTEYLDLILSVEIVSNLSQAIDMVNKYGSAHSEAIVTKDELAANAFFQGVDSATIYWNASTRFTDGYEFGLGAEIGISTDRLHARGPMGLRELTTYKYCITGNGQVRS